MSITGPNLIDSAYEVSEGVNDAQIPASGNMAVVKAPLNPKPLLDAPYTMFMATNDQKTHSDDNIYNFTDHVKLDFSEVFGGPEYYSHNTAVIGMNPVIKSIIGSLYEYTQAGVYFVLTLVFGPPLALLYGLFIGIINFISLWLCTPYFKCIFIALRLCHILIRAVLRSVLDPLFESLALVYSAIKVNFTANITDMNIQAVQGTHRDSQA